MPPFGNLYGVPVYADASLAKDEEIVFNAGTHQVGNDETAARDRSFFDSPVTWEGRAARATGPGVWRGSRTPENFQLRRVCRYLPKSSIGGRQSVFRMQRKPQGSCGSLVDPPVLGLFEDPGAPARSIMVRPDAEGSSARGDERGRKLP
jgi:hypothetical protein